MKIFKLYFVFHLFFIFTSCSSSSPESVRVRNLIELGKKEMVQNNWSNAISNFNQALDIDPDNPEATFGYVYASIFKKIQDINDLVVEIINLLSQIGFSNLIQTPLSLENALHPSTYPLSSTWGSKRQGINLILFSILNTNILMFLEDMSERLEKIKNYENFSFTINNFIYSLNAGGLFSFSIDLSGEYDLGEVFFIESVMKILDGVIKMFLSIDLDIKLATITKISKYITNSNWNQRLSQNFSEAVFNIISVILNEQLNLLGLEPSEGREILLDGALNLASGFENMARGLDFIFKEKDPQENDILGASEDKPNTLILPGTSGGQFIKYELQLPSNITSSIENIQKNLSGDSSVRINWARDIAPLLAVGVYMIINSGLLESVIDLLLSQIEDPEIVNLIKGFLSPGVLTVDLLQGFITVIIGNVLEFDLGYFVRNPSSLRELLPAWTDEADPYFEKLVIEWECPSSELDPELLYLICKKGTSADSSHFYYPYNYAAEITGGRLPSSIYPDGLTSDFPYFAWQKPDFGGLLYINYYNLNPSKTEVCGRMINSNEVFHKPDLCEINSFLVELVQNILDVIRQGF